MKFFKRIPSFPVLCAILLIFTSLFSSRAEETRFFRITGPVTTTITALNANGEVTWTNAATNAVFTVQTIQSLGQTNWLDYIKVPCSNSITTHRIYDPNPPFGMAYIPAGSFTMGDTFGEGYSDELPLHSVYVSAFHMDKFEVTKALWDEVRIWALTNGYSFDSVGSGKAPNHPVHTINWYDMIKWCNARSEKEGRVPAYYTGLAQTTVYRTGQVGVQNDWVNWNAGYRLPTEAEWEKAARGGASGRRFSWADADIITYGHANYSSYSGYSYDTNLTRGFHPAFATGDYPYTSPIGYFAVNGYGLHDLAGNVFEWCWDWYSSSYYSESSTTDPRGPVSGTYRVLRGGSWADFADAARCASRFRVVPNPNYRFGFRCVRKL